MINSPPPFIENKYTRPDQGEQHGQAGPPWAALMLAPTRTAPVINWQDPLVVELWEESEKHYEPNNCCVDFDPYVLIRLIEDLFFETNTECSSEPIDDGDAPGFSSAITLFYAKDPESEFNNAITILKNRLLQA